jgi:hypothetical protein
VSAFRNNELFRAASLTLNSSTDHVTAGTVNATTGRAGAIDISRAGSGLLVVNVVNAPTGTNPTLAVFFDVLDATGLVWVQTSAATSVGGALLTSTGYTYGQISTGYTLTNQGRIRWVVGGTDTPTFTGVSFSVHGRP